MATSSNRPKQYSHGSFLFGWQDMRSHFIGKNGKFFKKRHSSIVWGKSKRSSKDDCTALLAGGKNYKVLGKSAWILTCIKKILPSMLQSRSLHLVQVGCMFLDEISVPSHLMGLKEVTLSEGCLCHCLIFADSVMVEFHLFSSVINIV